MKKADNFLVIITCVFFLTLGVLFFILPKKSFSSAENRALTPAPSLTADSVGTGKYMTDFAKWYADTFPGRDFFVSLKAYSELLQGKCENNGVLRLSDRLIPLPKENDLNTLKSNLRAISDFRDSVEIPVTVCAIPRVCDAYSYLLPSFYPTKENDELFIAFFDYSSGFSFNTCDVRKTLYSGDYYYKTDHHYTTDGAFAVYSQLSSSLGYEPYSLDDFERVRICDDFCGTSMRTSGMYLEDKDEIYLYRYNGDEDYEVVCDDKTGGLYDFSALGKTDKYSVFLGGNHARVDISAPEERENILIVRDSFADSLSPFLSRNYDLTLIDLRYYKSSVKELVKNGEYKSVLVLMSITALEENSGLQYLYK